MFSINISCCEAEWIDVVGHMLFDQCRDDVEAEKKTQVSPSEICSLSQSFFFLRMQRKISIWTCHREICSFYSCSLPSLKHPGRLLMLNFQPGIWANPVTHPLHFIQAFSCLAHPTCWLNCSPGPSIRAAGKGRRSHLHPWYLVSFKSERSRAVWMDIPSLLLQAFWQIVTFCGKGYDLSGKKEEEEWGYLYAINYSAGNACTNCSCGRNPNVGKRWLVWFTCASNRDVEPLFGFLSCLLCKQTHTRTNTVFVRRVN